MPPERKVPPTRASLSFSVSIINPSSRRNVPQRGLHEDVRGRRGERACMESLDLRDRPPRGPRLPLADLDLFMLARTVDKLRATLPGGSLGTYQIPGFSTRLLSLLGVTEDDVRDVVARANSDEEVAAWVRDHTDRSQYAKINATLERRKISDRLGDPDFVAKYPIAQRLPADMPLLDFLASDDEDMFPGTRPR